MTIAVDLGRKATKQLNKQTVKKYHVRADSYTVGRLQINNTTIESSVRKKTWTSEQDFGTYHLCSIPLINT